MKELKFRAWDKGLRVLRDARYIDLEKGEVSYWLNHKTDYSDIVEPFKNVELMQHIGIKDFDGKEIYEGDIVHFKNNLFDFIGEVIFDKCFYVIDKEKICADMLIDRNFKGKFLKVIGNIYETQSF